MKRKDVAAYTIKQAAIDHCVELRKNGIRASWFRNKSKQYVVFYWEA